MGRKSNKNTDLWHDIQKYEAKEAEVKALLQKTRLKLESKTKIPMDRLLKREKDLQKKLIRTRRQLFKKENFYRKNFLKRHEE